MARRKSFMSALVQAGRAAERQRIAQIRAQTRAVKEADHARKAYERATQQAARDVQRVQQAQSRADQQTERERLQAQRAYEKEQAQLYKEQVRLYTEARIAEVALQNEQLEQEIEELNGLLQNALSLDSFLDLEKLKQAPEIPPPPAFGLDGLAELMPSLDSYLPTGLSAIRKLIPGAKEKYAQEVAIAQARFEADLDAYNKREAERQARLSTAKAKYEQQLAELQEQTAAQNAEIDKLRQDFIEGAPTALATYFVLVLELSTYPEGFPQQVKAAFIPESKQLVLEYDLPAFEIIPQVGSYKYVKTQDETIETVRPLAQRKTLYASVIAQVALRTLHEVFMADHLSHVESIIFNGYVDSINKGTGRPVRTCLITVRASRDTFTQIDLSKVDPAACLKVLNAAISKSPTELVPVRPVLEFNMIDPRFIQETDILSSLDQRQNLLGTLE